MKNFLLIFLIALPTQMVFAKEIILSPGSSTIVDQELVTVGCSGENQITQFCKDENGKTFLYKNEFRDQESPAAKIIAEFNTIVDCLTAIGNRAPSTLEIALTAGSSAIIDRALVTVSCADDNKAKYSCRGKFGRTLLVKNTTEPNEKRTFQIVKSLGSMEECLAFVQSGGDQQANAESNVPPVKSKATTTKTTGSTGKR